MDKEGICIFRQYLLILNGLNIQKKKKQGKKKSMTLYHSGVRPLVYNYQFDLVIKKTLQKRARPLAGAQRGGRIAAD
jgi:hypothetical protein